MAKIVQNFDSNKLVQRENCITCHNIFSDIHTQWDKLTFNFVKTYEQGVNSILTAVTTKTFSSERYIIDAFQNRSDNVNLGVYI
jgi:hypothetical protein